MLCFLANCDIDFPAATAHALRATVQARAFQWDVLPKPGIRNDLGGGSGSGILVRMQYLFFRTRITSITGHFFVQITTPAWAENGGRTIDKYLDQDQEGLDKANGEQVRALNHNQAAPRSQHVSHFLDGVRVIDIFGRECADNGIEGVRA